MDKQMYTPVETAGSSQTEEEPQSVIVQLNPAGAARICKAPPDTLVMVVESKTITAAGRRSLAAGGAGSDLATDTGQAHERPEPRQIAVSFPG